MFGLNMMSHDTAVLLPCQPVSGINRRGHLVRAKQSIDGVRRPVRQGMRGGITQHQCSRADSIHYINTIIVDAAVVM